jgi:hypothetical protein
LVRHVSCEGRLRAFHHRLHTHHACHVTPGTPHLLERLGRAQQHRLLRGHQLRLGTHHGHQLLLPHAAAEQLGQLRQLLQQPLLRRDHQPPVQPWRLGSGRALQRSKRQAECPRGSSQSRVHCRLWLWQQLRQLQQRLQQLRRGQRQQRLQGCPALL